MLSVAALISVLSMGSSAASQPPVSANTMEMTAVTHPFKVPPHLHPKLIRKPRPRRISFETRAARFVKKFIGYPYVYGGSSPSTGFDCSGLTEYVYHSLGRHIPRTAQDQYDYMKRIPEKDIRAGDLVFFHETSDPGSYVYHVGMLVGTRYMVAAATESQGVVLQRWDWGGDTVTFGTLP